MKMEVLSRGQFGVIGSTKVKDWTSPLTSPLPPHHRQHHHHHRNHHQSNRHHHSFSHYSSNNVKAIASDVAAGAAAAATTANNQGNVDVVDGFMPKIVDGQRQRSISSSFASSDEQLQQQHQQQQKEQSFEQYYHHLYHHNQAMPAALATLARSSTLSSSPPLNYDKGINNGSVVVTGDDDDVVVDASNIDYQAAMAAAVTPSPPLSSSPLQSPLYNISRYNSNLICCGGNITAAAAAAAGAGAAGGCGLDIDAAAINELSMRLQSELRAAKSRHLACTEVSLPWDLTPRIAAEIIRLSEKEPCGIRGCTIYIEFEDEPSNTRRIASLKIDPNTVSTFELYLTLKHDKSGWTSLLPQFIKNLTRSSSIIISPDFSLTKNKLYHSSSE